MKYKVGDKVKLKNRKGRFWNAEGDMDCYMGKVVTISKIDGHSFEIEEDNRNRGTLKWSFDFDDIEEKISQKHFKSLPNNYTGTIEVENGFIKEILDTAEKEYLSAVISPFRDKVKAINKTSICGDEFIRVDLKNEPSFSLPNFKAETMYKGMELYKEYSLEELGLDA